MAALRADDRGVILACSACGKANRVAFDRLAAAVRCGQCHTAMAPPAAPVDVSSARAFDALVATSSLPVLVDFWAAWCGPCKMVAPHLAHVAARRAGRLLVAKVDTDAVSDLSARLGIRSIPTLAVFTAGREAARRSGAMAADEIEAFVDAASSI